MSEEPISAAEAFDALREEVSKLRNGMELICKQGQEIKTASKPVDYNPTLGGMVKQLGTIEDNLRHIERAMPMQVARLPEEQFLPHQLVAITEEAKAAALELREATRHAIKQRAVRWWLAGMAGFGVAIGIALCISTAAIFPQAAGSWMAATMVGGDPWDAGQVLMHQGDSADFNRMVQLYQACPQNASVELCRAAMAVKTAVAAGQ